MSRDKRRKTRKATEQLEVCCAISNKEFKGYVSNISETGICLRTPEEVKKGEKLDLKIRLFPHLPSVKNIISKVVWKAEDGTYGLKFKRINEEALELLQGFVNN